jgi:hypothetical protein
MHSTMRLGDAFSDLGIDVETRIAGAGGVALFVVQNERNLVAGKRRKVHSRCLEVDIPPTACSRRRRQRDYFLAASPAMLKDDAPLRL